MSAPECGFAIGTVALKIGKLKTWLNMKTKENIKKSRVG